MNKFQSENKSQSENKFQSENPYEPPDHGSQQEKRGRSYSQIPAEVKAVTRRVRDGESKTAIFEEYKGTDLERPILKAITLIPSADNSKRFFKLTIFNTVLFLGFFGIQLIIAMKNSQSTSLLLIAIGGSFYLYVTYQITRQIRDGYWFEMLFGLSPGFYIYQRYELYESNVGTVGILILVVYGVVVAGLAFVLLVKLFPRNLPFKGIAKDDRGNPLFEN